MVRLLAREAAGAWLAGEGNTETVKEKSNGQAKDP
jgi:hypothetical protein